MRSDFFKNKAKTLENTRFSRVWSCWADSNRRPHPYQVAKCRPALDFQGFPALSARKDEVFDHLVSTVSAHLFPRVGHGVGQATIPVFCAKPSKPLSSSVKTNNIDSIFATVVLTFLSGSFFTRLCLLAQNLHRCNQRKPFLKKAERG